MKKTSRFTTGLSFALLVGFGSLGVTVPPTAYSQQAAKDKIAIPDTTPAIWAEIDKQQADLTSTVQAKKLADVHRFAYNIRDLVAALPAKAAADKKTRVEGAAKNVAALADKLDAAGDSGKQAETEAGLKQLDALLKQLKAQFPDAA